MTPTAIRDTVGCNCSCSGCAREREKRRGARQTKKEGNVAEGDIGGGRVEERTREREATVNGCVHCTLSPCPASVPRSVISETSAPRESRARHVYIYTYMYVTICTRGCRLYVYICRCIYRSCIDTTVHTREKESYA